MEYALRIVGLKALSRFGGTAGRVAIAEVEFRTKICRPPLVVELMIRLNLGSEPAAYS